MWCGDTGELGFTAEPVAAPRRGRVMDGCLSSPIIKLPGKRACVPVKSAGRTSSPVDSVAAEKFAGLGEALFAKGRTI